MTKASVTPSASTSEPNNRDLPRVALLRTTPDSVLADYANLMRIAGYKQVICTNTPTALKVNVSWQHWYPACSTTPWQIDGVIRTLKDDGFQTELMYAAHNRTVVVSARQGEVRNKHLPVVQRHGIANVHLYDDSEWVQYKPHTPLLVLDKIFPEGIRIPKRLIGSNIIHLPTVKTHVFTTITGAMKNAFGGLLFEKRHFCHSEIHKTLVDLLVIQQEIHPGIFAVVDGTFAGSGPGPRCMRVAERGVILAGSDQVAVDAVCARLMGFDPLDIPFLRIAHDRGLGVADLREIDIVGEDVESLSWETERQRETFASRGQKLIYWGPLKRLEKLLLRSWIAPWSFLASRVYHDLYWYNIVGRRRIRLALKTGWGRLFQRY